MTLGWLRWRAWSPLVACGAATLWQAWHLATWTSHLRGRRGAWRHPPALCVAGVALLKLGLALVARLQRGKKHVQPWLLVQAAAFLVCLTEIWCKPCLTYFLACFAETLCKPFWHVLQKLGDRTVVQAILACLTETWCKQCLTYFSACLTETLRKPFWHV